MPETETAILGGGCFWCTEAVFKMLKGVKSVEPGYARGAEVVKIEYDTAEIKYTDLLTVFFASHDPTTLNKQGNDVGTQYRSVIFYTNEEQKNKIEEFLREIDLEVVTEVIPLDKFYPAEEYHKDYYQNNPQNPYCELVINPKLEKVQKKFAELLKNNE